MVKRLAVIPARGGSKRLPRKNVVEFGGRPMLAWTIEAVRLTNLFDRIFVSTEDEEIADIARREGVEVPFLREEFYDDFTPISQVTIAAVRQLRDSLAEDYDTVVQLMANCPLRNADDIRTAVEAFDVADADYQISCVKFGWLSPWWAFKRDADGRGEWLYPDAVSSRSQDLPPLFAPTGATWIARVPALEKDGTFYGPDHRFQPLDWISAIDIDDEDDLKFAKAAHAVRHGLI